MGRLFGKKGSLKGPEELFDAQNRDRPLHVVARAHKRPFALAFLQAFHQQAFAADHPLDRAEALLHNRSAAPVLLGLLLHALANALGVTRFLERKLRCYQLKQWGKSGYRNLRRLGVDRCIAWATSKSPHGPWRLSRTPGVNWALNNNYWPGKGLIGLSELA